MSSFEDLYKFADMASMYNIYQSTREEDLVRAFGFIPALKDEKIINVKKKVGRKSEFDKCKEDRLNRDLGD